MGEPYSQPDLLFFTTFFFSCDQLQDNVTYVAFQSTSWPQGSAASLNITCNASAPAPSIPQPTLDAGSGAELMSAIRLFSKLDAGGTVRLTRDSSVAGALGWSDDGLLVHDALTVAGGSSAAVARPPLLDLANVGQLLLVGPHGSVTLSGVTLANMCAGLWGGGYTAAGTAANASTNLVDGSMRATRLAAAMRPMGSALAAIAYDRSLPRLTLANSTLVVGRDEVLAVGYWVFLAAGCAFPDACAAVSPLSDFLRGVGGAAVLGDGALHVGHMERCAGKWEKGRAGGMARMLWWVGACRGSRCLVSRMWLNFDDLYWYWVRCPRPSQQPLHLTPGPLHNMASKTVDTHTHMRLARASHIMANCHTPPPLVVAACAVRRGCGATSHSPRRSRRGWIQQLAMWRWRWHPVSPRCVCGCVRMRALEHMCLTAGHDEHGPYMPST